MGFLDTLTKNLGFNNEEPVVSTRIIPPTQQKQTMVSKAFGTPSPLITSISKAIKPEETVQAPIVTAIKKNTPSLQELSKSVAGLPAELGRAVITRPIRSVIRSFEDIGGYLGDPNYKPEPFKPTTPVEQALFGKEQIKSYPEQAKDLIKISKEIQQPITGENGEVFFKGVDKKLAIPLAFLGTIGVPLGDLLPGGGEKKKIVEGVFKGVIDDIVEAGMKTANDTDSFKVFKEAGVSDDIAREQAPKLTLAKTKQESESIIRDTAAKQLQKTQADTVVRIEDLSNKQKGITITPEGTKVKVEPQFLTADELDELNFLTKNKNKPENILIANKFAEVQDDITRTVSKNLADEARKYKTADDFVSAQGDELYHGTSKGGAKNISDVGFIDTGRGGVSLTAERRTAEGYGQQGEVIYASISKNAKLIDGGEFEKIVDDIIKETKSNYVSKAEQLLVDTEAANRAKAIGFDGVDYRKSGTVGLDKGEVRVWNPDVIKTKSQLTDIWNKAQQSENIKQIDETKALETAAGTTKERGYITSVKASEKIDDMIKGQIAGEYTTKSNKGLVERATQRVANDIEEAKTLATSEATDEAIATGTSLMARYSDEIANTTSKEAQITIAKEAADIINKQAEILTEAGRTIQAASLIGKQTPEGLLMTTARKIKEYNKLNPTKKVPELTPENVIEVLEKGKKIEGMAEGLAKEVAKKDLADTLQSLIPAPMWKKIVHVWKAGLLTGIQTLGINVNSTFFNGVLESAKNLPATGIDLATAIVTGKRTKVLVSPLKYMEGISEGAKKGWNYLKTGVEGEAIETGLEKYKVHYDSKVGKLLGKYADSIYRILGASDSLFYYGALKRSLVEQALVSIKNQKKSFTSVSERSKYITDFINNPSDEVLELAQLDAKVATFKNDTALGQAASALQNTPTIGPVLQMTVLPFAKTPSAVAMQMFNYTPAGLITTFYKGFMKGGFNQKEFAEGLGRVVTGTGALWLGSELWKKGKITLGYPKSEKERAQWEATGKTPNSILIEGKWVPLTTFGPAGNVMTIGGYFSKGRDDTGSTAGGVASGLAGGLQNLTEQTFLTGVKNAMDAINEPEKKGVSWIGNTLASVVPSIVNNINQSFDDYQRKSSGTILGPLKARLPGIRQTLPKKLDVWGQPLERNRSELGVALSPLRLSNTIESPLNTEVERLGMLGEDIRPTKADAQIRNIKLTPEEHYKYQRIYGNHLVKGLNGLIKNPEYQKLDPEQQAIEWKRTTKEIKKVVNERVLPELMKRRYELDENVNPELFTNAVNYYYKENPKFAKASPDKQKKFILLKIQ